MNDPETSNEPPIRMHPLPPRKRNVPFPTQERGEEGYSRVGSNLAKEL